MAVGRLLALRDIPRDRINSVACGAKRTFNELRHRGRQLIIFPEGTRRAVGAEPRYKYGVSYLYAAEGVAVLPIALNSGLFWPRRSFLRHPGTVVVEILDPIAPGLDKNVFFQRLRDEMEAATERLVAGGEPGRHVH